MPNIGFSRFFANPIRLSATSPQDIPGILKLHAQLYEDAAVVLDSIKSGNVEPFPGNWRHLQHYHILPLCRAIVVLLDELLPPPAVNADGLISLDEEVQRRTAVMIITEDSRGLSSPISFDAIRSESLPLARSDLDSADQSHIIRVSLKVAVQFVAELQKRDETLAPIAADDDVDPIAASKFDGVFAAVESADEYVDGILNESAKNPLDQWEIRDALENIERTEKGGRFI